MEDYKAELLIEEAKQAEENAYCPYSGFAVGAAVLCADGSVYSGANIENASYSLSMCAERVAIFKAVADARFDIEAVAVFHDGNRMPYPCGACLQTLAEFNKDMEIIVASDSAVKQFKLAELLPNGFTLTDD